LYAGSSKGLDETRQLRHLDFWIASGRIKNCVVVYRPHPWRQYPPGETDFFEREWRHVVMDPSMIESYQRSRGGDRMYVELADYEEAHVALSAADCVVSPMSTMLLEAAMHGKPVMGFLDRSPKRTAAYAVGHMQFFQWLFSLDGAYLCDNP